MKPAGGISTAKISLQYLVMLRETLGEDWLTPDLYRIGASRLANDILMQLMKEQTGDTSPAITFRRISQSEELP